MSKDHALYRHFDADGNLLYVGITHDPGIRWKQHRDDKPWWHAVASTSVERYPDRESALAAERAAILAESPIHNIVHNRSTSSGKKVKVAQLTRVQPFQVGDWAALGLKDGRCPVGQIAAYDETWVALRLKEYLMGSLTNEVIAVRWEEVERAELAYLEDAERHEFYGRVMDDEHLGEFQTAWQRTHLGEEGDPVQKARAEYRREKWLMEREERAV